MFIKQNKGQSILEYGILLGVVVAGLLIMQVIVKRGVQGSLKDSADKMGEQFSAGNTTTLNQRVLEEDQVITEEVATSTEIATFLPAGTTLKNTLDNSAFSYTERAGGKQTATAQVNTDSASKEKIRWSEYQTNEVTDFTQ